MSYISFDIYFNIFSHLDSNSLLQRCQVNSEWNCIASNDVIWTELIKQVFDGNAPKIKNLKRQCVEFNKIINCCQSFLSRFSIGHSAQFNCILNLGPNQQMITVVFKDTRTISEEFDIELEHCAELNNNFLLLPFHERFEPQLFRFHYNKQEEKEENTHRIQYSSALVPYSAQIEFSDHPINESNTLDFYEKISDLVEVKLKNLSNQYSNEKTIKHFFTPILILFSIGPWINHAFPQLGIADQILPNHYIVPLAILIGGVFMSRFNS